MASLRIIDSYLDAIDRAQLLAFAQHHIESSERQIRLHPAFAGVQVKSIDCGTPYPFEHVQDNKRFQLAWQANTLFVATLERVLELRSVMRSRDAIVRTLGAASAPVAIATMQLLANIVTAVDDIERDFATAARVGVHRQHEHGQSDSTGHFACLPCCRETHERVSAAMRSFVANVCKLMKQMQKTPADGASGARASCTQSSADKSE